MTGNEDAASPTQNALRCTTALDPLIRGAVFIVITLGLGLYSFYEIIQGKYVGEPASLYFTWALALVCTPVGAFFLGKTILLARQVLVADDAGIGYEGQEPLAWSQIERIVVRGKGLIDLYGPGERVLKLDSWKLKQFTELTALIEQKTPEVEIEQPEQEK